jgi:HAD superfamily hydrolase (TIGR01509 family)
VIPLLHRRHWVFDMDGTLTVAMHDFAGLKARLGLPTDRAVLEGIALRPEAERAALLEAVDDWEIALADAARAAPDTRPLLEALTARQARLGVLTRNTRETALRTLRAAGLAGYFADADVLGRDCALPKPSPDGVLRLLGRWEAEPADAVVVGDYVFDLRAGRAAGAATVWIDRAGAGTWASEADRVVTSFDELLQG